MRAPQDFNLDGRHPLAVWQTLDATGAARVEGGMAEAEVEAEAQFDVKGRIPSSSAHRHNSSAQQCLKETLTRVQEADLTVPG